MTIDVQMLRPQDAHLLQHVHPGVFDKPVSEDWAKELLADRRHHLAVAREGDLVVGFASAVDYIHPDKPVELWINEVSVGEEYRRAGVGQRLLQALFRHGRELGCREAWVLADPDNHAARGLYEAANGRPEFAVLYTFGIEREPLP